MDERAVRHWRRSQCVPGMLLVSPPGEVEEMICGGRTSVRDVRGMKAFRVLVLAILFVVCFPRIAAASHLQGGTIYWERDVSFGLPIAPTDVRYNVVIDLYLRSSFYLNPPATIGATLTPLPGAENILEWGPASSQVTKLEPLALVVRSMNLDQDLLIASATVPITVPLDSPALRFTVRDCCRPDALADGNGGKDLVLEAIIPALNPLTSMPRSPFPTSLPRLYFEQGKPAEFSLAVSAGGTLPLQPPAGLMLLETLPNRYRPTPPPAGVGPSR